MYRKSNPNQLSFEDFYLPFGGKLRRDKRWMILSKQTPWTEVESESIVHFSEENVGPRRNTPGWPLGHCSLKERPGATARGLVQQITENPYPPDDRPIKTPPRFMMRLHPGRHQTPHRQKARRAYLTVSKARQPGRKLMRRGVGRQPGDVKRNLQSISSMAREGLLTQLAPTQYRQVLIINALYRRQEEMHINKIHRISEDIARKGGFDYRALPLEGRKSGQMKIQHIGQKIHSISLSQI